MVVALVPLSGCPSVGYFVCSNDTECTEVEGGRCEASGSCSFPDETCETNRRYGELGNPSTAGECVPPTDVGSTGGGVVDSASGEASSSSSSSSSSTDADTSSSSSSGGSTTSGSSSSSGGEPVLPDVWGPCSTSDDCLGFCVETQTVFGDPLGHYCSQDCSSPQSECPDPMTGADARCVSLFVDGQLVDACLLDCTDTGDAGCPEGMVCLGEGMPELGASRCGFAAD